MPTLLKTKGSVLLSQLIVSNSLCHFDLKTLLLELFSSSVAMCSFVNVDCVLATVYNVHGMSVSLLYNLPFVINAPLGYA